MEKPSEVGFRGDGAEMCGPSKDQQFCMGVQKMDSDAIHPKTGKSMYKEKVVVGGRERILYKNYHSSDGIAISAIALRKESVKIMKDVFGDFFKFGESLKINGLMENGAASSGFHAIFLRCL